MLDVIGAGATAIADSWRLSMSILRSAKPWKTKPINIQKDDHILQSQQQLRPSWLPYFNGKTWLFVVTLLRTSCSLIKMLSWSFYRFQFLKTRFKAPGPRREYTTCPRLWYEYGGNRQGPRVCLLSELLQVKSNHYPSQCTTNFE